MNIIEAIEANKVDLSGFTDTQKQTILAFVKCAFRQGYVTRSNEIIDKENEN